MNPHLQGFPARLIHARNIKGWSSMDLCHELRCTPSLIFNLENERNQPNATTVVRLCKALNVSADYLLGLKEEMI